MIMLKLFWVDQIGEREGSWKNAGNDYDESKEAMAQRNADCELKEIIINGRFHPLNHQRLLDNN